MKKFKKLQTVHVDWKDDSCNAGTSDDGSYTGKAIFIKYVKKGMVGDELLVQGPHAIVKTSKDDKGSFFPVSAISDIK